MSSVPKICTAEEIAEKRRMALEIRQKKESERLLRKQKLNNENSGHRIGMNGAALPQPLITAEQRAEIEKNRLAAIERAKQNKLIDEKKAKDLIEKKVSPGKIQESVVGRNRVHPYLKPRNENPRDSSSTKSSTTVPSSATVQVPPATKIAQVINQNSANLLNAKDPAPGKSAAPSKTVIPNQRSAPYQKPNANLLPKKPDKPVYITLEFISESRFIARMDNFSEQAINQFKKMRTRDYSKFLIYFFQVFNPNQFKFLF
jgi:hypothetical protein